MKNLFSSLLVLSLAGLSGCSLYFGNESDDRWNYCANDGYYVCQGESCEWAGPGCPSDPQYQCETNADCAAGCYCSDAGICEEGGFCDAATDCPDGYTCETERSSCVPDAPPTCAVDADCAAGEYCDAGACVASCACTTDAEAQAQGFGFCDEVRGTCEPTPLEGTCAAEVTCNIVRPTCATGEVALIKDGCYTGTCGAIATCDVTPTCGSLQFETDCLGRTDECSAVYTGINCTNSQGTSCTAGSTNCTCESFRFNSCTDRSSAMMVYALEDGTMVDVFSTH